MNNFYDNNDNELTFYHYRLNLESLILRATFADDIIIEDNGKEFVFESVPNTGKKERLITQSISSLLHSSKTNVLGGIL